MADNPDYPFSIYMTWDDKRNGHSEMHNMNIGINFIDQTSDEIAAEIISQLNEFLETCNIAHQYCTNTRYENAIYINWNNANGSSDFFELRFDNIYTFGHFTLEGGADCYN
jgi:hypothetical protein